MKLYRLITGPDNSDFCMRITEALNNGWELHGSPILTFNGIETIAGQAIVKVVEDQEFSQDIRLEKY